MATSEHNVSGAVELSMDDPDDFEMLYDEFRGVPGIQVQAVPAPIDAGDQGSVLEFLTVACSGGAITVALEIVKTLVESRRPKFILKARHGKDRLEITTDNVDEALPLLRKMLGD